MKRQFCAAIVAVLLVLGVAVDSVFADVYLHNMRGNNNRLNEANTNRNNANRLFDSQNNAKGGYAAGELNPTGTFVAKPMEFFEGSYLPLEWTNQHGCGPNMNLHCEIILQYMCDDGNKIYSGQQWAMTDGTDTGGAGTQNPPTTGRNEPDRYRTKCTTRDRNKGLFIADRNLNGQTAAFTRQNNDGTRYGNECPEERDYYPYWHPSPWKDIAILTSNTSRCDYYKQNSQNKHSKGECECANWDSATGCGATSACWKYNNAAACAAATDGNGQQCVWAVKNHGNLFWPHSDAEANLPDPDCIEAPYTRVNHNGNDMSGEAPTYNWKLPTTAEACGNANGDCGFCFMRIRYNISTGDLNNLESWQLPEGVANTTYPRDYFFIDYRFNGDRTIKMDNHSNYFADNEVIDIGAGGGIKLAHNTNQVGRTFQDRSYMFVLKNRAAAGVPADKDIYNINVRGKRGNIVQVYPAVEYDFVPNVLEVESDDLIHFQWVGSNRNPAGNDGQGQAGTDRNNLIQFRDLNTNFPLPVEEYTMFDDKNLILAFATSGKGTDADPTLDNASPYFDSFAANGNRLLSFKPGEYVYGCTRNNNFTNRSQKAKLIVKQAGSGARKIVTPSAVAADKAAAKVEENVVIAKPVGHILHRN
eukprot:GEZU01033035.1.p1 GENE.GEZU01033035.1~~GEZU01033035.1.p1  ORF type:complete len:643 (-),score=247.12 GEZU01033035.1:301-2229(-)